MSRPDRPSDPPPEPPAPDRAQPDLPAGSARERRGPDHGRALIDRAERQSQWLALFVGFVTALAVSVVVLGDVLQSVADEVRTITVAVAAAVLAAGVLLLLVYATRHRLFALLSLPTPGTLSDVVLKLRLGLRAWGGDRASSIERFSEGITSLAAWMAWTRLRTWMVATLVGAASIFVLLVGEVLLLRQNRLIEEQNAYLREQNQNIQSQLRLEREQSYQARRSGLVAALYDRAACARPPCAHVASLRARSDAARAFTEIELGRRAELVGTVTPELCATGAAAHPRLDLRHLDLAPVAGRGEDSPPMEAALPRWTACGADLSRADLTRVVLSGSDLRRADLGRATLTGVDLTDADLRRADLNGARMADGGLRGARLAGARLDRAWLRGADLSPAGEGAEARPTDLVGASLRRATLTGADLSGAILRGADLRESDLTDADLSGADLTGARLADSARRSVKWSGATCPDGSKAGDTCEGRLRPAGR